MRRVTARLRRWCGGLGVAIAVMLITVSHSSAGAATAMAPVISIRASSSLPVVTGDVLVSAWPASQHKAKISGRVTDAAAGDVIRLLAQPFPFKRPPVAVRGRELRRSTARYSFTVRPNIATRYSVELLASASGSGLARSRSRTIYVTYGSYWRPATYPPCARPARPVCRMVSRLVAYYPAAIARAEADKHWYPYLVVLRWRGHAPGHPKWLYLRPRNIAVGKPHRVSASEYVIRLKISFWVGSYSYRPWWDLCTRDTEAKDGFGLPSRHGCGAKRISWKAANTYLG